MKKTKKLTSALIGALTLSMTLGGFVAPAALAEPNPDLANNPPTVICCDEHAANHFLVESYDDVIAAVYYYEYEYKGDSNMSYKLMEMDESHLFKPTIKIGGVYVFDGGKYWACNSSVVPTIPTCDHKDLTHHEAAAGEDCKHFGTIEYWQCNNEDCGKMFSDEACKTEIENTSDGVFGNHDLETKFDDNNHWLACNVCNNTYSDVIEHKYGSDESNYICLGCGYKNIAAYAEIRGYEIIKDTRGIIDEIKGYGLPEESFKQYEKMIKNIFGSIKMTTDSVKTEEDVDKELAPVMPAVLAIKAEALAEYKEPITKSLDSLNEELTNAVKYVDVHDLSRDAALELLAVINEAGKNEIIAGGTKEGVDNAHETAASSQRSIAEMIFNYEMFDILDGEDITILQNSDDTVSVRADALCERFLGVTVDEELVAPENYTVESGSTIVTFNNDFLNTLTVGKHTVAMVWIDGMSTSKLTIVAPVIMPRTVEEPKADDAGIAPLALDPVVEKKAEVKADAPAAEIPAAVAEAVKTNEIPSTGDNNMMTMWLALAAIALAAGTAAVVYKKESR